MRSVAVLRLANFVTGFTPGRLFQMSSSRWLSFPMRSANCSSVENTPEPVSRAAFREAWKVMLFSESIVKCFIVFVLCAVITAVTTFITPFGNTSKAILLGFATNLRWSKVVRMMVARDSRWRSLRYNGGPQSWKAMSL